MNDETCLATTNHSDCTTDVRREGCAAKGQRIFISLVSQLLEGIGGCQRGPDLLSTPFGLGMASRRGWWVPFEFEGIGQGGSRRHFWCCSDPVADQDGFNRRGEGASSARGLGG